MQLQDVSNSRNTIDGFVEKILIVGICNLQDVSSSKNTINGFIDNSANC